MKNFYFKVNRRHIVMLVLSAMVLVVVTLFNAIPVFAQEPPISPTPTVQKRPIIDLIEKLKSSFLPAPPYEYSGTNTGTTPYPSVTPSNFFPSGVPTIPAGHCTDLLNTALDNLERVKTQVLPVYQQAATAENVPWEALAAIHYIETGGTFNPNGSLISGRPLGVPEPDYGGQIFHSLYETAVAAANVYKAKGDIVDFVIAQNDMPAPTELEKIMGRFAAYNAVTQGECELNRSTFIYTGRTWTGIPDNSQCTGKPGAHTKGEAFLGDRHVYSAYCLDENHTNMYFHFHYGDNVRQYTNRLGALALIAGIQQRLINIPNVTPTPPPGTGFLRNPTDSQTISAEVIARCQRNYITTNTSMTQCMPLMTTVSDRYRSKVTSNNAHTYFQCTQHAVGLAYEINGVFPNVSYACNMKNQSSSSPYRFIPKTQSPPLPGDLVIWDSVDGNINICEDDDDDHVGHIAYVSSIPNPESIVVAEANTNHKGRVMYRAKAITSNMVGWLRKK